MELTEDDVRRFVEACNDPTNAAARETMRASGASSASGVVARLILSSGEQRDQLLNLIRLAISGVCDPNASSVSRSSQATR